MSVVTADRVQASRADPMMLEMPISDLAAAVFCSTLQPSDSPGSAAVRGVVREALRRSGDALIYCAGEVAAHYGEDPESACRRMRWARSAVIATFFAGQAAA